MDNYDTSLEAMSKRAAVADPCASQYAGVAQGSANLRFSQANQGPRLRHKGEEDRQALSYVLRALDCDISIAALEKAIATVKTHLEN